MTATSQSRGHRLIFRDGTWVYGDLNRVIQESRPCGHCGKKPVPVRVKIPADLSSTGEEKWRVCLIDACVAPLVAALQAAGIDMRGSCCGHGEMDGDIALQDGRILVVKPDAGEYYEWRGRKS